MTSCYTPWKIPRVRVTLLDDCGQPVTGTCSTVVSSGIISVAMTDEYEEQEEHYQKNGDGTYCVQEANAPILKWINLVITFCNVDPDLVNITTADPVVYDDAATPTATGYRRVQGSAASSNFALEGWTRIAGLSGASCTGGPEYGYGLLPWIIQGRRGDVTWENGLATFVVNARTKQGSLWGTGPYFVDYSDNPAGSTTDIALLTAVAADEHHRFFLTRKPPPDSACGCTELSSLTPG